LTGKERTEISQKTFGFMFFYEAQEEQINLEYTMALFCEFAKLIEWTF
jgi:hypothetical protein